LIDVLNGTIDNLKHSINENNKEIESINNSLTVYKEQIDRETTYKLYQKCVHRDVIPTTLLKRSIDVINEELQVYLKDLDYICFFNEDLQLKVSHYARLSAEQNAIECSGKERTFIALGLKLALRSINNTSRPNFILLDEMTGKLIGESVNEFKILLESIKDFINKIIIIEHNHNINYDYRLHVDKNDKYISKIEFV